MSIYRRQVLAWCDRRDPNRLFHHGLAAQHTLVFVLWNYGCGGSIQAAFAVPCPSDGTSTGHTFDLASLSATPGCDDLIVRHWPNASSCWRKRASSIPSVSVRVLTWARLEPGACRLDRQGSDHPLGSDRSSQQTGSTLSVHNHRLDGLARASAAAAHPY